MPPPPKKYALAGIVIVTAVAIALHLINKQKPGDRPQRFVVVNRSTPRLQRLQEMVRGLDTDITFEYIHSQDPHRLVA